jgi:hypothetical protein
MRRQTNIENLLSSTFSSLREIIATFVKSSPHRNMSTYNQRTKGDVTSDHRTVAKKAGFEESLTSGQILEVDPYRLTLNTPVFTFNEDYMSPSSKRQGHCHPKGVHVRVPQTC